MFVHADRDIQASRAKFIIQEGESLADKLRDTRRQADIQTNKYEWAGRRMYRQAEKHAHRHGDV